MKTPRRTKTASRFRLIASLALSLLALGTSAAPQSLPTLDYTGRPGEKRPELLEQRPPAAQPVLPAAPLPPVATAESGAPAAGLMVRKIVVVGSTVLSEAEIARATAPYLDRSLTVDELETLRRELTLLYVRRGYINSGAVIPDQAVQDGQVTLRVVEGELTGIDIEGTKWFGKRFLHDRIALGGGRPLNLAPLQERLQLLQQDPRIQSLHAELRPGDRIGESNLKVRVVEARPVTVWLGFNNYQSPSIGAERGLATIAHRNLSGHGDPLSLTYGYSDGLNPLLDVSYAVPLNARDTTLILRYRHNDTKVVDDVFGPLDIVSKTQSAEVAIRQPLYRTLSQELALTLGAEYELSRTWLAGEPFSFSAGVDNGRSVVVPIRFSQEWTYRTQREVVAVRSRFSLGTGAFGATGNGEAGVPDGHFFAWLGQFQYARILQFLDVQLLARVDAQRSAEPLLPVEQFGIGGRYTVRGYRENLLVRDQGVIASLETRVPLLQQQRWADYLLFCQFVDYGQGENKSGGTPTPSDLASVGLGLRWAATPVKLPFELKLEAETYWGHQLRRVTRTHSDLQDEGIHLQVAVSSTF